MDAPYAPGNAVMVRLGYPLGTRVGVVEAVLRDPDPRETAPRYKVQLEGGWCRAYEVDLSPAAKQEALF